MKKYIVIVFALALCGFLMNSVEANSASGKTLADAIKQYKSGNYATSYEVLSEITKEDPSNAVALYYLAITCVQVGKQSEAIENYDKVLALVPNGKLNVYANKGKTCLELPEKCAEQGETDLDTFVQSKFGNGFSQEVNNAFEEKKLENMMREMNRKNDIAPQRFKEFKDYSSEVPTNDEIVTALRVLQKAGLGNMIGAGQNYSSDLSALLGNRTSSDDMFNMLMGGSTSNINPQIIQSLLTNQMSTSF